MALCQVIVCRLGLPSVGDAVAQGGVLVLDRLCASRVVDDREICVHFARSEAHEPPSVVGCHVEAECFGHIALFSSMETYQRLVKAAGVVVGEALSP